MWGRSPTADCSQAPSVSDEDLQAQAWFPATLTSMLHLAELAASVTLDTCEQTSCPYQSVLLASNVTHQACLLQWLSSFNPAQVYADADDIP